MKNRMILLTLILYIIVVFTGCTSSDKEGDNHAPAIDTPGSKELSDLEKVEKYIAIIGSSDYDMTRTFGTGKATVLEGTDLVQLRRYNMNLFGQSLSMVTSLEDGNVADMSITPESGTYEDWFNRITGSLGIPDETIAVYQNQSDEVRASAWNLNDGSFTLQSACGTVVLRMNGRIK